MASQHSTTADFSSRYKFNGKELDKETGWYYYGARYYDPQVSTWLSVDPLAEKYIGFSPYNFTLENPVRLVDPDGRKIWIWYKHKRIRYENGKLFNRDGSVYNGSGVRVKKDGTIVYKGFLKRTVKALNMIRNGGSNGKKLISDLQKDKKDVFIKKGSKNQAVGLNVQWNPSKNSSGIDENGKTKISSYINLAHELAHAHDALDGNVDMRVWFAISDGQKIPEAEKYATHWENRIRAENDLPLRAFYAIDNGVGKGQLINGRQSLYYTQTISIPNIHYNYKFSNNRFILVPSVQNTKRIIPYQY